MRQHPSAAARDEHGNDPDTTPKPTGVAAFARSRVMLTAAASEPGLHAQLKHAHMGASS